jgi:hypothetical protein
MKRKLRKLNASYKKTGDATHSVDSYLYTTELVMLLQQAANAFADFISRCAMRQ